MLLTEQLVVEDMDGALPPVPAAAGRRPCTLATVLKGNRFFGMDEETLFDLAHERRFSPVARRVRRRAGGDARIAARRRVAGRAPGTRGFRAPPYELFAEVLAALGGRRAALARVGPEAADPLDEFLSLALAYERMHGPSPQRLFPPLVSARAARPR